MDSAHPGQIPNTFQVTFTSGALEATVEEPSSHRFYGQVSALKEVLWPLKFEEPRAYENS